MTLDDAGTEISHRTGAIGLHLCLRILNHHTTIFIVGIRNGESILGQSIEESFLGITVVLKGLVVVQMVTSKIGKETTCKFQSANTLLGNSMTGALHKGILTACLYHLSQQSVEFDGIRSGMVGRNHLVLDIVADSRKQTALVTKLTEHII